MVLACFAALNLPASAEVEREMATGINIPGGDILNYPLQVPDPAYCRLACDQNPQCRGWTFVKPGIQGAYAMCWIKGAVGTGQVDPNTISGVKPAGGGPEPGGARVENAMSLGYDLPGSDIGSLALPRSDPSLCQQACDANGSCAAWSFVKTGAQGPNAICFLKGAVPRAVANDNVISGLRLQPMPPPRGGGGGAGGGGGGGGAAPGAGAGAAGSGAWGVWAYDGQPPFDFADPCGIQYVASPLAGSRYAANPAYILVRTRENQRDADLDIHEFSVFHKNQPDGVVKMAPCPSGGTPSPAPPASGNAGGGGGDYRAWITGTFESDWGKVVFSPSGGTYAYANGTFVVTRIDGPDVEGIWRQEGAGEKCTDGTYSGRFRFTFTATGFSGSWGRCEKPFEGSWSGKRL